MYKDQVLLTPQPDRRTAPITPHRTLLVATAAAVLTVETAAPADADPTTATLTVTGGTLDITVQTDHRNLGSTSTPSTISGKLGQVVVTDRRGAPAGSGWVATVTATPFTSTEGPAIPASRLAYTAGPITKTGTAAYTANNPKHLHRPAAAAVTATNITGNNTATWTPTITLNIPVGLPAGTYTATITHSVL